VMSQSFANRTSYVVGRVALALSLVTGPGGLMGGYAADRLLPAADPAIDRPWQDLAVTTSGYVANMILFGLNWFMIRSWGKRSIRRRVAITAVALWLLCAVPAAIYFAILIG